jgi:hypothetical protein
MNLVQQFPDISENLRTKNGMGNRHSRSANSKQSLAYVEDETVVQYYEGEFRKWHFKFLVILAAIFGMIYFLLLKSFWIYNLINIR